MDSPHYILDEAAKWRRCPMGMGQKIDLEHSFCLGSECMAWRWGTSYKWDEDADRPEVTYSTTHGYCGMVRNQ
jgi:hypothetical protein